MKYLFSPLYDLSIWPAGVFVRRYYEPRLHRGTNGETAVGRGENSSRAQIDGALLPGALASSSGEIEKCSAPCGTSNDS